MQCQLFAIVADQLEMDTLLRAEMYQIHEVVDPKINSPTVIKPKVVAYKYMYLSMYF